MMSLRDNIERFRLTRLGDHMRGKGVEAHFL